MLPARAEARSDPKIQQFYEIWPRRELRKNHVIGFQIAMNNPKLMSLVQSVTHLFDDAERALDSKPTAGNELSQGLTADVLHRNEERAVIGGSKIEYPNCILVGKLSYYSALSIEPGHNHLVVG